MSDLEKKEATAFRDVLIFNLICSDKRRFFQVETEEIFHHLMLLYAITFVVSVSLTSLTLWICCKDCVTRASIFGA